jgi:hypothetical protein
MKVKIPTERFERTIFPWVLNMINFCRESKGRGLERIKSQDPYLYAHERFSGSFQTRKHDPIY